MRTCPNPTCPDRVDLGLVGEYVDSVQVCPRCGVRLVQASPIDQEQAVSDARNADLEMVCVFGTGDEGLAALVKSIFDGYNIRYVVKGEGVQDLLGWGRIGGFNYAVGPAEFLVHRDDADRARALLTETEGLASEFPESDDDA